VLAARPTRRKQPVGQVRDARPGDLAARFTITHGCALLALRFIG
jgi:hypothetical protein